MLVLINVYSHTMLCVCANVNDDFFGYVFVSNFDQNYINNKQRNVHNSLFFYYVENYLTHS